MQTYREKFGGGRRKYVTNVVTVTNHIWSPSATEKDQDSEARVGLMEIIIFRKWDSFGGSETERKKRVCVLKYSKCKGLQTASSTHCIDLLN